MVTKCVSKKCIMSIDNSVEMYSVKHSSHGNHFQIKQLSAGQHAKFTWPTEPDVKSEWENLLPSSKFNPHDHMEMPPNIFFINSKTVANVTETLG